jgi:hypothetical protein
MPQIGTAHLAVAHTAHQCRRLPRAGREAKVKVKVDASSREAEEKLVQAKALLNNARQLESHFAERVTNPERMAFECGRPASPFAAVFLPIFIATSSAIVEIGPTAKARKTKSFWGSCQEKKA